MRPRPTWSRPAGRPAAGTSIRASERWSRCSRATTPAIKGLIPPYIVLTQPQGRFSEAGFLGTRYKPFATGGDPAQSRFAVEGVVAQGITDQRQKDRRELLQKVDTLEQAMKGNDALKTFDQAGEQAYDLILGDAGKVFDLTQEKSELRDSYGRTTFGQSCLVARRLVERGVPYVTINYGGWDTHEQHFQAMRRKLPEMDRGHGDPAPGSGRIAVCSTAPSSGGAASSAGPRRSPGNRPGTADVIISARSSLPCWPAADSRAAAWSGPPMQTGEQVKDRPVYPVRSDRQHV